MPPLRRLFFCLLVAPTAGCGLFYKHQHDTRAFTVYSDRDQQFLLEVTPRIETIYAGLSRHFDVTADELGRPAICVEGDETNVTDLRHAPDVLGYYLPWLNLISIGSWSVSRGRDALDQVLVHEVAHHFITTTWPAASSECWFNEGLAGALEMALVGDGCLETQLLNPILFQVAQRAALDNDAPISIRELLNMSWSRFHDEKTNELNYALAWSLVYFLLERHFPASLPLKTRIQQLQTLDRAEIAALEPAWRRFLRSFELGKALLDLARRGEPSSRLTSQWAFRQLGELRLAQDLEVFTGLAELFNSDDELLRESGCLAFASRLGLTCHSFVLENAVVRQGIQHLRTLATDRTTRPELRAALAEAFGSSRQERGSWFEPLVKLLDDEDGSARAAAAMALSRLGTKPTVINPAFWHSGSEAERALEIAEWRRWLGEGLPVRATFR